jgi:hypothetical protein
VFAVGARIAELDKDLAPDLGRLGETAKISQPSARRSRRKMFRRLDGAAVPGLAPICLDSNDPDTVASGFAKRVLRVLPQGDTARIEELSRFVREWCEGNLSPVHPLGFEEWLSQTTYNEARKNELREVHTQLRGGRPSRKVCKKIKSFVKTESYPVYKNCRLINSRSDFFKAYSGRYFKALENALYKNPHFIKHVPVPQRPSVVRGLKQAGRRYFMSDFTAFESHFTPAVMNAIECVLYRYMFQNTPEDADFICDVITGENEMSTRTGVRASVKGRRMSGDMCTSLGNGFTNLMLAKFLAHKQGKELYGFVEGDDGLFATEACLDTNDYAQLGFTIKIEEIADPCLGSFCGMVFTDTDEIIRNPIDFCANFGWTSSFIHAGDAIMRQLLRAKALSACYETPQCPIVGALARLALRQTRGVVPRWVESYKQQPKDEFPIPDFCPSSQARETVHHLYGISPANQLLAEARIARGDTNIADLFGNTGDYSHFAARYIERF